MYKLLVITCLILSLGATPANASTLTWSTISGYGPTLGNLQYGRLTPQHLFGEITGLFIETNVLDDWSFILTETSQVRVSVSALEANTGSLLYAVNLDGDALDRVVGTTDESWLFDNTLSAGAHTINILGIATSLANTSGYQVNVTATVVPIPGLGWILGACFLMIFNRSRLH